MGRDNLDLLKGTLGLLLLKAVSGEPRHGHDIMKWIRRVTGGEFAVEEGAIYPALHRLEGRGLLAASWDLTENNRQAKYYRLTASGRRELARQSAEWDRYVASMGRIMNSDTAT